MLQQAIIILLGISFGFADIQVDQNHNLTVSTPLGTLQGSLLNTRLGKPVFSFRGIPYAKAPINGLRFQPPVPEDKWEGTLDATRDAPSCPQRKFPVFQPFSEDCLFINVYTRQLQGQEKRPVLIWFHPGGFYSFNGNSEWFGPQYLLDHDVVLVTANYRLGALGFLSTGDKEVPGNNGFKDQVLVMKWVKDNIASFGGDPDLVTIFGCSAGGFSVTLHLVSPMSQGLFHRAIAMSGSVFGNPPISTGQLDLAKKLARFLQCPDDTSANVIKCLKTKSADEIGSSMGAFEEFGYHPLLIWNAVIEPDFGQSRFLATHPIESVLRGEFAKVPVIVGITHDEFAGPAFDLVKKPTLLDEINKNFAEKAPIAFQYERDTENSKNISEGLKQFYFQDKPIDKSSIPRLTQIFADSIIGFGINRAAKILSEKNSEPVYYYRLNYKGRYSNFYLPDSNFTIPYGTTHHDDLIYMFHMSKMFPEIKETDRESIIVDKFTTLWANFAKAGNPIPEPTDKLDNIIWEPYTLATQQYLDIGTKLVLQEKLYEQRYQTWDKLFPLSQYYTPDKA